MHRHLVETRWCTEPYNLGKAGNWLAKGRNGVHGSAQRMLEPSFGEPGHCFPLQGNMGFVEIKLRTGIVPNAITLEHVAKSVAYDSSPKYCRVSGWFESPEENPLSRAEKIFLLKEFAYYLEKSSVQTFNFESPSLAVVNTSRPTMEVYPTLASIALECMVTNLTRRC